MHKLNTYEKWLASILKAEVVCAELLNRNIAFEKIKYTANSSFKKSFRSDVATVEASDDNIEISVNRDGLYDKIPEGFFHQTRGNSGSKVSEMVAEHKRYKAEEKFARRFFNPFEQEFFRYSTMVEQTERLLSGSMYDDRMQQLFRDLWGLEDNLPKDASGMFTRMMPWAYSIKSDLQLTAKTLEIILNKPVNYEEIITEQYQESDSKISLGDCALGMETLAGSSVSMPMVIWKFVINNVSASEIEQYTSKNSYGLLLRKFEDFFIPLDVDAVFDFTTAASEEGEEADAILGYSLTI